MSSDIELVGTRIAAGERVTVLTGAAISARRRALPLG
jgi:hypothetical protein